MTNQGVFGPSTPGSRLAGLHDFSAATYGSAPIYDPATGRYMLRVGGSKYDAKLSAYNATGSSLGRWRAQLSKALTSSSVANILCLGDSITQGITSTPQRLFNWPAKLRTILATDGRFGVVGESGAYNTGQFTSSYDERWTAGTGWGRVPSGLLNGAMWQNFNTASVLSFALPTCDSVTIDWARYSGAGTTMSYNIDGGSNTTINMNGATAVQSTTFSVTRGTHTLNINSAASGFTMIEGVRWSDSVAPLDVGVYTGGGASGQSSAQLIEAGGSTPGNLAMIDFLKPDLTLIAMGRNDAGGATSPASFKANMQTIIRRCRVTNGIDPMLLMPPPANTQTYVLESLVRRSMFELADSEDVALIDLTAAFGTDWNAAPKSLSGDNIHPNDAGSWQLAWFVAQVLANA